MNDPKMMMIYPNKMIIDLIMMMIDPNMMMIDLNMISGSIAKMFQTFDPKMMLI